MADIVKFETNIPLKVQLAPKPGDWFGEPQAGEYQGKPTMQYKYKVSTEVTPDGLTYATPLLHDIIRASGVQAGETVVITRKARDWVVDTGIGLYDKASLSMKAPVPVEQVAPERSAGLAMPDPSSPLTFNEVACLVWKSSRAAAHILTSSGLAFSASEVSSLGAQIAIRCERERVRPTPEDMVQFARDMKDGGKVGPVSTIGSDGLASLLNVADTAGISTAEMEEAMGRIYMKETKTNRYPTDLSDFPVSMVEHVEAWIDARKRVASLV